jgi:hypothetical protein
LSLPVTPELSDIVTFASATNIATVKATTKTDTFCITGGPQESDVKLEDSFFIKSLLPNPEDKSVAKDVAQKIQKFYFEDKSNSASIFSSTTDVRNNFLFCSHSTKFSKSIQIVSLTVREKLGSTVLDNRILWGISKLQDAHQEKDVDTYVCELS